jgi:hypothetical protein
MRSHWIHGIQEFDKLYTQLLKIHRLSYIRIKPGFDAFSIDIAENIGGKGDYWEVFILVFALPFAYVLAGLVAIFVGHVEVALFGVG